MSVVSPTVRRTHEKSMSHGSLFPKLFVIVVASNIVFPYSYMQIKMGLIGVTLLVGFAERARAIRWLPPVFGWFTAYMLFSLIWTGWGLLQGNSLFALGRALQSGVLYPLIYMLLAGMLVQRDDVETFLDGIQYLNLAACLLALLFVASTIMGWNIPVLTAIMSNSISEVTFSHMSGISGYFINEMIFTSPFVLTSLFVKEKKNILGMLNIVISVFAIMLSGRRVIQITMIAFFVILFILRWGRVEFLRSLAIVVLGIVIAVGVVYLQKWLVDQSLTAKGGVEYRFSRLFVADSSNARYVQIHELLKGFFQNPIMGSGLGGVLESGYIRSVSSPWSFELSYLSMLYHTGVVGIIYYALLLLIPFKFLKEIGGVDHDSPYVLPLTFGYISILVANAVDPYLGIFDMQWMIFIIPIYYNSFFVQYSE